MSYSIKARVFYAIRFHDVELAEDFHRRCGDVNSITELNQFFHLLLTQYPTGLHNLRSALVETDNIEIWLFHFTGQILPYLKRKRLPPCTDKTVDAYYCSYAITG